MTDISQDFAEAIAADIEQQQEQNTLQQQVSQTLPFAVLQVLGVIHNGTKETPNGLLTMLGQKDFEFVSGTLQGILNLMGWQPVLSKENEDGTKEIALVPLGAIDQAAEDLDSQSLDGQATTEAQEGV